MTTLHDLSAHHLSDAFRRRTVSPVEVTLAVIAHVERWEPQLCAMWGFDPEGALAMARAAEARWQHGQPLSALDGVPVTIKENIATRGVALPLGTAASERVPAAEDAPVAARLREAGCVFLGKTTMPDYGMLSSGLSSFHQLARNPWNLALNPGGSSAGAGAAAAAGYGPLHVGTDIGGSIRLPASWCGIFGLKPSNGRVPIKPPYIGRVAGPMTRTVTDAALMMSVLSRPDWRDATSLPVQDIDWLALDVEVKGLRLGLLLDAGWGLPTDPEVRACIADAARRFEAAGALVEPLAPFTKPEVPAGMDHFWRMRSWLDMSALPEERRARVLPFIRDWVAPAAGMDAPTLFRGFSRIAELRDAAVAASQPFDFVLSPVSPVASFPAEWAMPSNDPARAMDHIGFTLPYNMSEQPSASVPAGHTADGRPIGLQITGRRHDDLGVLRLSRAWEHLRAPQPAWPQAPAGATA
jgi:Asp-tRNA(Asn)/Glu-tRNA(Gln) amidotransferase A subunit family amidase